MRLSSAVRQGGGGMAPGSAILLWESFAGSVKAMQMVSFATMGSVKRLS